MTVGFARLRAARLTHVSLRAAAKWEQFMDIKARGVRDAYDHFKIWFGIADFAGLLDDLQVAACVGEAAGFFVCVSSRQHDVRNRCGFSQEHVLHNDKAT